MHLLFGCGIFTCSCTCVAARHRFDSPLSLSDCKQKCHLCIQISFIPLRYFLQNYYTSLFLCAYVLPEELYVSHGLSIYMHLRTSWKSIYYIHLRFSVHMFLRKVFSGEHASTTWTVAVCWTARGRGVMSVSSGAPYTHGQLLDHVSAATYRIKHCTGW